MINLGSNAMSTLTAVVEKVKQPVGLLLLCSCSLLPGFAQIPTEKVGGANCVYLAHEHDEAMRARDGRAIFQIDEEWNKAGCNSLPKTTPEQLATFGVSSATISDYKSPFDSFGNFNEITVAVLGPNENPKCREGRIIFGAAQHIALTTLDGKAVASKQNGSTDASLPNSNPQDLAPAGMPYIIDDNQLIKLPDGSVIHSMEVLGAGDVSPMPSWWNDFSDYPAKGVLKQSGVRGKIALMRSTDCGATWAEDPKYPAIDVATLQIPDPSGVPTLGLCAHPRLYSGPPSSQVGGPDGHSLYADPTGTLYVSTSCMYGTDIVDGPTQNVGIALRLIPGATEWQLIGYLPGTTLWRAPWTALSTGQVPFALWSSTNTVIQNSFSSSSPPVSLLPVNLSSGKSLDDSVYFPSLDPATQKALNVPGYLSAARGFGGFLLAVPHAEGPNQALGYKIWALDPDGNNPSKVTDIAPLSSYFSSVAPFLPARLNAYHGTFIEGPPGSDIALFYWLEQTPHISPTLPTGWTISYTFTVKFKIIANRLEVSDTQDLSRLDGKTYSWIYDHPKNTMTGATFLGDYIHGSSYFDEQSNAVKFVASWSEAAASANAPNSLALRFAVVTVPFLSKASPKKEPASSGTPTHGQPEATKCVTYNGQRCPPAKPPETAPCIRYKGQPCKEKEEQKTPK